MKLDTICKKCDKKYSYDIEKEIIKSDCCSEKCRKAYFLITGSGFNTNLSEKEVLSVNRKMIMKSSKDLIEIHNNKEGRK